MPAAIDMVDRFLTDETVQAVKERIGVLRPRILPVLAVESVGHNKIPLAMAEVLARRLGLEVELGILQCDKVARTGTGADHRLAFNPMFSGDVQVGQNYLIVDDTLTMGGTVASLRGYIENRGGTVVAAAVMTAREGALNLPVKGKMLATIEAKHGAAMNQFWQETFGYGLDKLTQGEAGHLRAAATVDAIRTRITAARHAGIERLGKRGTEAPGRAARGFVQAEVTVVRGGNTDGSIQEIAESLEPEQQALFEAATLEQRYQDSLAVYVQEKHNQVERIEDRLEGIIDRQQARLQQMQSRAPGLLATPRIRRTWQVQLTRQQTRLQTLHHRLETVHEIKQGMGLNSSKLEELATRKMRTEHPELAADWDTMRAATRRHQAMLRKQEQQRKQRQEHSRGQTLDLFKPPR